MPSEASTIDTRELTIPQDKIQLLEEIVGERNRVQGLIAKAEASKDRVKEAIYKKVIAEYESSLAEIAGRFEPVRAEVAEMLKSIREKEMRLRADLDSVNEHLEELRFRCEVGEFDAQELETREKEKASEVETLKEKLSTIDQTYETCRTYLGEDDFNEAIETEPPEGEGFDAPPSPEEEVISVEDVAVPPPPPPQDVDIMASPPSENMDDLDVKADDLFVEAAPPPPAPEPKPEAEAEDPMMYGDPELTLSEPIPVPGHDSGSTTLDGEGDVEATISFQKRAVINLVKEDGSLDTYLLGMDPLSIGRNHRNDVVLLDRSISRKHAEVKKESQGYTIQDLSSGGGILINGEKKKRSALKSGDEIQIGDFKLIFKEEMG